MSKILELAEELVNLIKSQGEGQVELSTLKPGEKFKNDLGTFIVLEQEEGITRVIQEGFYEKNVIFDDDTCDYTKSSLKKKFDTEILKAFEEAFGEENIINHVVTLKSVDMQEYDSFDCKVRPITFDEARKYNSILVNRDLPGWYWTCTPWSSEERGWKYSVTIVTPDGNFGSGRCSSRDGVRPFCILKSNILVSKED